MKQQLALAAQDAYGRQQQVPGLPPTWEVQVVPHGTLGAQAISIGKLWESHGKTIGKSRENDGNIMGT